MPNGKTPTAADVQLKRDLAQDLADLTGRASELQARPPATGPAAAVIEASRRQRIDEIQDQRRAILKKIDANLKQFEAPGESFGPIDTRLAAFFDAYGGGAGGDDDPVLTEKRRLFNGLQTLIAEAERSDNTLEQTIAARKAANSAATAAQKFLNENGHAAGPQANMDAKAVEERLRQAIIDEMTAVPAEEPPAGPTPPQPPPAPPPQVGIGLAPGFAEPPKKKTPKQEADELKKAVDSGCSFVPPLTPSEEKTIANAAAGKTELGPTQIKRLKERLKQPCPPPPIPIGAVPSNGLMDLRGTGGGQAIRTQLAADIAAGQRAAARAGHVVMPVAPLMDLRGHGKPLVT